MTNEAKDLVSRLRKSLADDYYAGRITSSALTESLNLERQEAATMIERLSERLAELEARSLPPISG
jgi:hypothetical protein